MVGVEHMLIVTAGLFLIFIIMILFLAGKKTKKVKPKRVYLKADMIKIKEQISETE